MNNIKFKLLILFTILFSTITFAQEWKTLPDDFGGQCQTSFIEKVNSGKISLESLPSNTQWDWVVYSDRAENKLYNKANGSYNGFTLAYMEALSVKQVKGDWLHVFGKKDENEKGWIQARYLLLSNYSLKSEGAISIPRKAIVLTSMDNASGGSSDEMDQIQVQKNYYNQPIVSASAILRTPSSFEIMFIMKEQDGSVLLANTDILNAQDPTMNKGKVYGWIPKVNITDWNSRVALEPARSADAVKHYAGRKLPGYKDLRDLKSVFDNNKYALNPIVEFKVEAIRNNRMRKPILEVTDKNIRRVVSIAKGAEGMEADEDQRDAWKKMVENLDRKSAMTNIVFAVDATQSMGPFMRSVANSISNIVEENEKLGQHQLKFGLVVYRDYADGKKAYSSVPLTTDFKSFQRKVRAIVCQSKDSDLPEAQYNGLIKGISHLNLDETQSNVVVLIGDCGNHKPDIGPDKYTLDDVVKILHEKSINLISYQVKRGADDSYNVFNSDARKFTFKTAQAIIKGKETSLKPNWINVGNNTYKLKWLSKKKEQNYQNMFGRFIYASTKKPMNPDILEQSIVETLKEYMESVDKNIKELRDNLKGKPSSGLDHEELSEGIIVEMMDIFKCTRKKAIDFLTKNEVTTEAYVAIDYDAGWPSQVPVVFLTENEKRNLIKSLRRLTGGECISDEDQKKCLKENMIEVCKTILGPKTSTAIIEKFTLQQVWKLILGVDFGNKKLGKKRLIEIININPRIFKKFYKEFESTAKAFCDREYENSDPLKSRRFSIFRSYYFWIPLEDLPGTKSK